MIGTSSHVDRELEVIRPGAIHSRGRRRVAVTTRYPVTHPGGVERVALGLLEGIGQMESAWTPRHLAAFGGRRGVAKVPVLGDLVASVKLGMGVLPGYSAVLVNGAEYAWGPMIAGKLRGIPVVVVWHGVRGSEVLPPAASTLGRLGQAAFTRWNDLLQRVALRRPAIVVGPGVGDEIRERFGAVGSVVVIPNGLPESTRGHSDVTADEVRTGSRTLRAFWVGTSPYKKGLDLALSAGEIARSRGLDFRLAVAGTAKPVASHTTADWVDWLGLLPPADVDRLWQRYDLFFFPTRYEACSMAVLEALSAGMPVLGSKVIAWQVGDAGETVGAPDPEAYAEALLRFADSDYRRAASLRALDRARCFSVQASVARYVEVLDDLCPASP